MRMPKVSSKKSGAPKAKGASRAKSGCYTCRIRRKKCDEIKNQQGYCQTCVRLRLECLGFGAKRPDYLKENGSVNEMREKIKSFLASQGMIKGHSSSAPRKAEPEPVTLRLQDDSRSSSESSETSGSSPRPLSIGDDDRHFLITSSTRDEKYCVGDAHHYDQPQLVLPGQDQELSPDTIYSPSLNHDVMFPALPFTSSSDSLVPAPPYGLTAHVSTLPPSYHWNFNTPFFDDDFMGSTGGQDQSFRFYSEPHNQLDNLIVHYILKVIKLQYALAEPSVETLMIQAANADNTAGDAMRFLARIHQKQLCNQSARDPEMRSLYQSIVRTFEYPRQFTPEDAIAALQTVSSFLFMGGSGQWRQWLGVACKFSEEMLKQPYIWSTTTLPQCQKLCFILTTAMWFDVLASVTLMQPPLLLNEYRTLFRPATTMNARTNEAGGVPGFHPTLTMMTGMGCENHVAWAIAEVSDLASWKKSQKQSGRLSTPWLVDRGREIERHLLPRAGPPCPYTQGLSLARQLTAEIYRTAARVYLHSVLSDDLPHSREIKACVEDTINCLKKIPRGGDGEVARKVVRSVVFAIYLCGCLADNEEQVRFLCELLAEQEERVGNCSSARGLIEVMWEKRSRQPTSMPVKWREELLKKNLLLV